MRMVGWYNVYDTYLTVKWLTMKTSLHVGVIKTNCFIPSHVYIEHKSIRRNPAQCFYIKKKHYWKWHRAIIIKVCTMSFQYIMLHCALCGWIVCNHYHICSLFQTFSGYSMFLCQYCIYEEFMSRVSLGNACYHSVQNTLSSSLRT